MSAKIILISTQGQTILCLSYQNTENNESKRLSQYSVYFILSPQHHVYIVCTLIIIIFLYRIDFI